MKKSSTFNLEQDIYNEIEEYKVTYNLSSRNIALERMLLERRNLLIVIDMIKRDSNSNENRIIVKKTEYSEKGILDNSLKDSFDNMPD